VPSGWHRAEWAKRFSYTGLPRLGSNDDDPPHLSRQHSQAVGGGGFFWLRTV
jgi:hypothetical protein